MSFVRACGTSLVRWMALQCVCVVLPSSEYFLSPLEGASVRFSVRVPVSVRHVAIGARPSGNGGTLLLYFAPVLLLYSRLSKITTGTI